MAKPIDGAESYSSDGKTAAIVSGDRTSVCLRAAADSDKADTCATVPAPIRQVTVAPVGQTAVIVEDFAETFEARMWLFSMIDGALHEVPTLGEECRSQASPSASYMFAQLEDASEPPEYLGAVWLNNTTVIAIDQQRSASCLVAVNTQDLTLEPVITIENTESRSFAGLLSASGSTVVAPIRTDGGPALLVADLATGQNRTLTISTADSGLDQLDGIYPLAISPDGASALISLADVKNFVTVKMARIDLRTAQINVFTGFADDTGRLGPAAGAAYSPDGSEVVALEWLDDRHFALVSASATDSRVRNVAQFDGEAPLQVRLTWSQENVLTPSLVSSVGGRGSLGGLAPWHWTT